MTLMTRQETIDYHRAKLAKLEAAGSTNGDLMQYHREGMEIFEEVPFRETESMVKLAKLLGKSLEEMKETHAAFYANERKLIK